MSRNYRAKTAGTLVALIAAAGAYVLSDAPLPFSQAGGVADVDQARTQLDSLRVAPEHDSGYDRDEWPHWEYVGDGCDARQAALKQHADQLVPGKGCAIPDGSWTSVYDGEVVTDPSELDIDHVVPLGEAHASGGHTWGEQRRATFANDTRFLLPVTASSNRSKSDQDPGEWMPPNAGHHCTYASTWIAAKSQSDLTVDQAERDALARVLNHC